MRRMRIVPLDGSRGVPKGSKVSNDRAIAPGGAVGGNGAAVSS